MGVHLGKELIRSKLPKKLSTNNNLLVLFLVLFITDLSVFLDIFLVRQILVILFLAFLPGLLIVYILRLNDLGIIEKIVLSVGLSISFLYFIGLLVNTVYPLFSNEKPLSTLPLLVSLNVIFLILIVFAHLINPVASFSGLSKSQLNEKEKALLLLPILFPPLSILGMHIMNTTANNTMLMILLLFIPIFIILISLMQNQFPVRLFPPLILLISISVVLMMGLRSNHVIGWDTHTEYYMFRLTSTQGHFHILGNDLLDACLSVTILPSVYNSLLNINPEILFKILYPALVSISPLVVYLISSKYINNFYSFLASIFFVFQQVILSTAINARTTVAILFFALSIMVLFHDKLDEPTKRLLFIIFAVSCVFSHYSTAYIFFFILFFVWLGVQGMLKFVDLHDCVFAGIYRSDKKNDAIKISKKLSPKTNLSSLNIHITIGSVILFLVVIFVWYGQITGTAFEVGVNFISSTANKLNEFFILESRSQGVAEAFGSGLTTYTIPQQITFAVSWLGIALIAVGVLYTLARYSSSVASFDGQEPLEFLLKRFDIEFFVLAIICSSLLVLSVLLPFILKGYSMERLFNQMLVVLSTFFVIGGVLIAELLGIKRSYLIIIIILVPYMLCYSGATSQLFGFPQSIALNSEGQQYYTLFVHDQDSVAARWLGASYLSGSTIGSDFTGATTVISQGNISFRLLDSAWFIEKKWTVDRYIFLRYRNVIDGKLLDYNRWLNLSDYEYTLINKNLIYDNGASEIWAIKNLNDIS